jgi:virginiamycin A acetyltransferase
MKISINNESLKKIHINKPYGQLGPMSRIIDTDLSPRFSIDKGSCINRSKTGQYFGLGCYSYVADTIIGRYCVFGSRVSIGPFNHPIDWLSVHDFQYRNTLDVFGENIYEEKNNGNRTKELDNKTIIGSDVWIADNVTIKRGVTVASGSIIGMSAVVLKDVPPYAIVAGNPAKIIRFRFEKEIIDELLKLEWWRHDMKELNGIEFKDISKAIKILNERFYS